ncbi:MAG TPA: hypothetical protein VHE55_15475 [Fimbriimonadaceae bacterium]|nr:hypothetical protein [Fimbriimonadaceae bacterium]
MRSIATCFAITGWERFAEDLREFARSDGQLTEATRQEYSAIVRSFFEPGADLDRALG